MFLEFWRFFICLAALPSSQGLESMPRSFLEDEYGSLGMPNEPKLEDKELISRLKQVGEANEKVLGAR